MSESHVTKKSSRKKYVRKTEQPVEETKTESTEAPEAPVVQKEEEKGSVDQREVGTDGRIDTILHNVSIVRFGKDGKLDLRQVRGAGMDLLKKVYSEAKDKFKEDADRIKEKVEKIVTQDVPEVAKLAALKIKKGAEPREVQELVTSLVNSHMSAIRGYAHSLKLRLIDEAISAFEQAVLGAIKIAAQLGLGALGKMV